MDPLDWIDGWPTVRGGYWWIHHARQSSGWATVSRCAIWRSGLAPAMLSMFASTLSGSAASAAAISAVGRWPH
jgi:hypothetical protein